MRQVSTPPHSAHRQVRRDEQRAFRLHPADALLPSVQTSLGRRDGICLAEAADTQI